MLESESKAHNSWEVMFNILSMFSNYGWIFTHLNKDRRRKMCAFSL